MGEFIDNLKNGKGKDVFGNGDSYEGDYMNGKPHGKGIYIWKNKASY